MKFRSRNACIAAAAIAAIYGNTAAFADDLTWDPDPVTAGAQGNNGNWDTTSLNWLNPAGTNVSWTNGAASNAFFGNATNAYTSTANQTVTLTTPITVGNITLGVGSNGTAFNIEDNGDLGALTLAGNIRKVAGQGSFRFTLGNGLTLTGGQHTISVNDSPNDTPPELVIASNMGGLGGININSAEAPDAYGTVVFLGDNSYAGPTNVSRGRLVFTRATGLGASSSVLTISNQGAVAIGGAGTTPGFITVNNPIVVTRSNYSDAPDAEFGRYKYAFATENLNNNTTHAATLSGPITLDSTDARFGAYTSTLTITSNMQQGANTSAAVFTAIGDFAGTIALQGNNSALLGGIRVLGGVEVDFTNQNNIGGPNSKIEMLGGTLHPKNGVISDLNTHTLNTSTWGGGVDVDANTTFTINQNLSGNSIGKRGAGTLNIGGANNLTGGTTFFDAGTVNFTNTGTSTYQSLHLRSATVNIGVGTVTTTNNYSSFGQDSTGTQGGPDKATVNVFGTGALVAGDADFNFSDNDNTAGTLNISGNGYVRTAGTSYFAKGVGTNATMTINGNGQFNSSSLVFIGQNNGTGTVTLNSGQINLTRNDNFTFVLGDGRNGTAAKGNFFMNGGTFTSSGEVFVGEGNSAGVSGAGTWTQTAGTATVNNWFVVGREGGVGTMILSGSAVLNHGVNGNLTMGDSNGPTGASHLIDVSGGAIINNTSGVVAVGNNGGRATMNMSGTSQLNDTGGEMWVGNAGGTNGTLNVGSAASVTVNNWFAVGRDNGTGTINQTGGTITKGGPNFLTIGSLGGNGTINVSGGTFTSNNSFIGEVSPGRFNLSGGTANFTDTTFVRLQTGAAGSLTVSGGRLNMATLTNAGNVNLTGGISNFGPINSGTIQTGNGSFNTSGTAIATATSIRQPSVTLGGTSTLTINQSGSPANVSTINTLAINNSAALDLTDNDLIVGSGTPRAQVVSYVKNARNNGQWNQPGLTASAAKPVVGGPTVAPTGLVVISAAQYTSVNPATNTSFDSVSLAGTETLVKYSWNGDVTLDGKIDANDYSRIDGGFVASQSNPNLVKEYFNGDFNFDGAIDANDYSLIDGAFTTQNGVLLRAVTYLTGGPVDPGDLGSIQTVIDHANEFGAVYVNSFLATNAPEPTSLGLVGVAAAGLLGRRRRRMHVVSA